MGSSYGKADFGLVKNGQAEYGDNTNFGIYSYYTSDSYAGEGSFLCNTRNTGNSSEYIEVDTSRSYRISCMVKTIANNGQGNPGSGYLGYTCYDKNYNYISLRDCGGIGNTYLTRDLNAGDTSFYIQSNSGWYIGSNTAWNFMGIYPATHPDYSTAFQYTKLTGYRYDSSTSFTLTAQGDYEVPLVSAFPNIGYSTPSGTPVMNARYGSGHNYAMASNQNYSTDWTRKTSGVMTGESRSGGAPFRFGTKYIRFLDLRNYRYRSQGPPYAQYLLDNIFLIDITNQDPDTRVFESTKQRRFRRSL